MEIKNKRQGDEREDISHNHKFAKTGEGENDIFPMEFGSNRSKRFQEGSYGGFGLQYSESDNSKKSNIINPQSINDSMIEEERINVKELHQMEKEQEEQLRDWKKQEEIFEFKQAVLKSKIRIENNRSKTIDQLAMLYLIVDKHIAIPYDVKSDSNRYPYKLFERMKLSDLQQLKTEVDVFQKLRHDSRIHDDYWNSIKELLEIKIVQEFSKKTLFQYSNLLYS